ncbi:hypothetical protein [Burkholderia sp. TSV86]|uniref:hypothetical protein n=1 Tax=Burkholderia sp. TSV86 TaxID=1385594 RepID=UPI00075373F8|nr:hypothetical protein [Burkholderia sp. TSV86]KVE38263.1 hypothetical protein WS68_24015 [Burkholderia sp. TSV86]
MLWITVIDAWPLGWRPIPGWVVVCSEWPIPRRRNALQAMPKLLKHLFACLYQLFGTLCLVAVPIRNAASQKPLHTWQKVILKYLEHIPLPCGVFEDLSLQIP